jgi:hypothetical protein
MSAIIGLFYHRLMHFFSSVLRHSKHQAATTLGKIETPRPLAL